MRMRRWRKVKVSLVVFAVISIGVTSGIVSNSLSVLPADEHEVVPYDTDIFPTTYISRELIRVVHVPAAASLGMKLALFSLQGIVNRHIAEIYLDMEGPANLSFLLPFLETRYHKRFQLTSEPDFFRNYSAFAKGLVVYDSKRPATVNVATVVAGLEDYIVVDESLAEYMSELTGLAVALDLRQPPWAGLNDIELQMKSFNEFYPRTNRTLLAILPPHKLGTRDYLIAAKVWTFYVRQGPFASQEEIDFTEDILRRTPHNVPVFGWFETPTLVEENFFVQMASRHGKFILGGQDVPNLSYLSTIRPREPFRQSLPNRAMVQPKESGIYITIAVPDGDNLDFIADKMHEMWLDEARGEVPVAWSVNPLLARLAPPLLDYYYFSRAYWDSFVAAPSGAGYLYPGFTPPENLAPYLARTKRLMLETDMDVVWLLNSFTAYEIRYDERTLRQYVTTLAPRGILLDYADQAVTRDTWMQSGEGAAAPVIRATHLWSSPENLVGKMMAVIESAPSRPHFFLVTVYPWALNLTDAVRSLDLIKGRYKERVNFVSIEGLLAGVLGGFAREARKSVNEARGNLLAALDPWDLGAADDYLAQMDINLAAGDPSLAGFHAYLALEHARRALSVATLVLIALIVLAFIWDVEILRRAASKKGTRRTWNGSAWILPGCGFAVIVYFFFAGLERALDYNFWLYGSVFAAGVAVVFATRLQRGLVAVLGRSALSAEILTLTVSSLFLLWEPWAFVPLACSAAMLLNRFLAEPGMRRETVAIWFGLGLAASFFIPFDWWSVTALAALVAFISPVLNLDLPPTQETQGKLKTGGVVFAATALALLVTFTALYRNRYFVEKADGAIGLMQAMTAVLLVIAPLMAVFAWDASKRARKFGALSALSASVVVWIALSYVQSLMLYCSVLLAIAVLVSWAFLSASERVDWNVAATSKFVTSLLLLASVVILLVRIPAIVYSLYILPLPTQVEYILYTPPLLMVFATIDIVQTEALFRAARSGRRTREATSGP